MKIVSRAEKMANVTTSTLGEVFKFLEMVLSIKNPNQNRAISPRMPSSDQVFRKMLCGYWKVSERMMAMRPRIIEINDNHPRPSLCRASERHSQPLLKKEGSSKCGLSPFLRGSGRGLWRIIKIELNTTIGAKKSPRAFG